MARVSTYLNFDGNAEEALEFYRKVFGTDYTSPPMRMGDVPADPNGPTLSEAEKQLVMHAELPILAGHVLMATDVVESMGQQLKIGNNTTINLEPDTLEETQRLYDLLSDGGPTRAAGGHVLGRHLGHLPRPLRRPVDVQLLPPRGLAAPRIRCSTEGGPGGCLDRRTVRGEAARAAGLQRCALRVERCDVGARRPDAEREGLPPFVDRRKANADSQFRGFDWRSPASSNSATSCPS